MCVGKQAKIRGTRGAGTSPTSNNIPVQCSLCCVLQTATANWFKTSETLILVHTLHPTDNYLYRKRSNKRRAMFDEIRKSTTGAFDKAKLLLNPNATTTTNATSGNAVTENTMTEDTETASQQSDRLEELSEFCPQLTYQQRLIGFVVSFSLGCTFIFFIV